MREKVHTTVMLMLTPDRQMRCLTIVATTLWVCSRTESRQRRSNAQSVGRPPDTNKVRELDLQVLVNVTGTFARKTGAEVTRYGIRFRFMFTVPRRGWRGCMPSSSCVSAILSVCCSTYTRTPWARPCEAKMWFSQRHFPHLMNRQPYPRPQQQGDRQLLY